MNCVYSVYRRPYEPLTFIACQCLGDELVSLVLLFALMFSCSVIMSLASCISFLPVTVEH